MSDAPETITEHELEEYFQRLQSARNVMGGAAGEAARIVRDIKAHREPEYERGQFYQDARGHVYFRLMGDGDGWSTMPEGKPYPGDYPLRPLHKLVPEGALAEAMRGIAARYRQMQRDYKLGVVLAPVAAAEAIEMALKEAGAS